MNKLCTILARGGSKGVPNKNIRMLAGKPLIAHSIAAARESGEFRSIAVSSDSPEILKIAKEAGADAFVLRPTHLASDVAAKLPAIAHCVIEIEKQLGMQFEVIVDLDPTSPLRITEDIRGCLELLVHGNATNVITACESRKSPYFNMIELDEKNVARVSKSPPAQIVRRQDAPKVFDMNASIYAWWRNCLLDNPSIWQDRTRLYVMPLDRSIDIDTEVDFRFVEFLMSNYLPVAQVREI